MVFFNLGSFLHFVSISEREFDADKHCGVWVAEHQKRCTRSLTCKVGQIAYSQLFLNGVYKTHTCC